MKKRFNRGKGNHNVVGKGLRNPADLAIKRRAVSMHKLSGRSWMTFDVRSGIRAYGANSRLFGHDDVS